MGYKGNSQMDSGYYPQGGNMTVSDRKNNAPTPYLDKVGSYMERIMDKMEAKAEQEAKDNPVGLFTKVLLCFICCARIMLGDNDPDVRALKNLATDETFKLGVEKEIKDNPEKFDHNMLG